MALDPVTIDEFRAYSTVKYDARHFEVNWPRAFAAGVLASALTAPARPLLAPRLDVEVLDAATAVGAFFFVRHDMRLAYWIGLAACCAASVLLPLVYAGVLKACRRQSRWPRGAVFGAVLWLIGPMVAIPMIMHASPIIQQQPGVFLLNMQEGGWVALFELGVYLVYGLLVGIVYKHRISYVANLFREAE